jgi:uncharacterized phage protein gp47/JayE
VADIAITAANVAAGSDAVIEKGTAGATITAGQVVYKDTADNRFKLVDSDSATAAARNPYGIALNSASSGQPLSVQRAGDITVGGTLTAGTAYYASSGTAGGIAPLADIASGDDPILLGLAKSAAVLQLKIIDPGVTL